MNTPKITIACPCYEMSNGLDFLMASFKALREQTFQDFEVVVSDDSINDDIRNLCLTYDKVRYIKNMNGRGMASNTNTAIQYSNGELIKILYQDDRLAHPDALKEIVENFTGEWLVTGCAHEPGTHVHLPTWNDKIYTGANTIGSPSVLTIRNNKPLLFDTKLTWILDCELYMRYKAKFGLPTILNDINVIITQGLHQTTHLLGDERKISEINYLTKKYE